MKLTNIIRNLVKQPEVSPVDIMQMAGMRERNEARIAKIKAEMGASYILHPSHKKSKLDAPRPV